jgi:hypothetical protein
MASMAPPLDTPLSHGSQSCPYVLMCYLLFLGLLLTRDSCHEKSRVVSQNWSLHARQ